MKKLITITCLLIEQFATAQSHYHEVCYRDDIVFSEIFIESKNSRIGFIKLGDYIFNYMNEQCRLNYWLCGEVAELNNYKGILIPCSIAPYSDMNTPSLACGFGKVFNFSISRSDPFQNKVIFGFRIYDGGLDFSSYANHCRIIKN